MKFDVVVGNPPYQQSNLNTRDDAVYNYFYDLAEKISNKYSIISPARFLFNAGSTDKKWNKKMLSDKHLRVMYYSSKSSEIFPGTDIKGGVAILYRDTSKNYGEIGTFTRFETLNSIVKKVSKLSNVTLNTIMSGQGIYKFTSLMHKNHPDAQNILSKNHLNDVGTAVLETLDNLVFYENMPNDNNSYIRIYGRYKNDRVYHWIREDYINKPFGHDTYRVILPKANGSGALGEKLSSPIVVKPITGFTQTFISIGAFKNRTEAENTLKYIKTKFTRTMLGVLKITQDNPKEKWSKVPLQDFTVDSDIDWTKSISEIDQQLYKKYELSDEEIAFIEEKVKPMD
ncbi:Eco57I restriction-modification methylase domain-containing protein [Aerococcus sp. 1KP-2016]|uniref:Eco57I restriction-modification methylase domain-containing protein n=1 Tax=Aerococcus sp. 1KP-2016 TaxID=1981982 RepID=UPI000B98075F|nr:Eco57I restriction-modification methylase domain-containing protein [Aerococcus sp. 1KP-2016]OYQ67936.1 DNA/RNA helicase [Aerococcus sp. 1KP-2016]